MASTPPPSTPKRTATSAFYAPTRDAVAQLLTAIVWALVVAYASMLVAWAAGSAT